MLVVIICKIIDKVLFDQNHAHENLYYYFIIVIILFPINTFGKIYFHLIVDLKYNHISYFIYNFLN